MSTKVVFIILTVVVVGFFAGAIVLKKSEAPRPGTAQDNLGGGHVASKQYGADQPPTSGDHSSTVPWGVNKEVVLDANVLHNLEHGGVYISYRPDLPKDQVAKIENLFSVPSSRDTFNPAKAVVAPRLENKAPIVISSWNRSKELTTFDESILYDYYVRNLNHSPEPLGR